MTEIWETDYETWYPEAGDIVTFTNLPPNAVNRGRRYLITGRDGNQVTYSPAWRGQHGGYRSTYTDELGNLWLHGIAKEAGQ